MFQSRFWLGCVHGMCVDNTSFPEVYSEKYIKNELLQQDILLLMCMSV